MTKAEILKDQKQKIEKLTKNLKKEKQILAYLKKTLK